MRDIMNTNINNHIQSVSREIKNTHINRVKSMAVNYQTEELTEFAGYKIVIEPFYLLNGNLVVEIRAIKKRILGLFIQIIRGGFEQSAQGEIIDLEKPSTTWMLVNRYENSIE